MFNLFEETRSKPRTVDSIKNQLINALAGDKRLSGSCEGVEGLRKIIIAEYTDAEFSQALGLIAEKMMGLFPEE